MSFDDDTSESTVLPEHIQFISRADDVDTCVADSVIDDSDVDDRDVIHMLDPLSVGENNNVCDVEIQEIWES